MNNDLESIAEPLDYTVLCPETHKFFNALRGIYSEKLHWEFAGSWLASAYLYMNYAEMGSLIADLRPAYLRLGVINMSQVSTANFLDDCLESLMLEILKAYGVYVEIYSEFGATKFCMNDISRLELIERIIALESVGRFNDSNDLFRKECILTPKNSS